MQDQFQYELPFDLEAEVFNKAVYAFEEYCRYAYKPNRYGMLVKERIDGIAVERNKLLKIISDMVEARNQLAEYARALKTEYDRFIEDAKIAKNKSAQVQYIDQLLGELYEN